MEIVDPTLESSFKMKEAERMIKVALLCINASPMGRPTMSEVMSMLEGQIRSQQVISDPSIYSKDLRFKPLKDHYQQMQDQSSLTKNESLISSSDKNKAWVSSSSISAYDLYPMNPESIKFNSSKTSLSCCSS